MATLIETAPASQDFAIPLVRVVARPHHVETRSPGRTAAVVGFAAGALGLALVEAIDPQAIASAVERAASLRGVPFAAGLTLAYVTAGTFGAIGGGFFGHVTRFLTKWAALALWSLIFFTSLALVILGASSVYHGGLRHDLAGPIIAATALYGFLLSFSLPIRRRG